MKRLIALMVAAFLLVAANVNHKIKISTADEGLDSVRCSTFVASTNISTFKLVGPPEDTVIVIPDTGNVKIICLYYFTGETGYRLSSEIVPENFVAAGGGTIPGANRTCSLYVIDTSGTDSPIPAARLNVQLTDGTVKLQFDADAQGLCKDINGNLPIVTDGSWLFNAYEDGFVVASRVIIVSANFRDTLKGYDIAPSTPPSANLASVRGTVKYMNDNPMDSVIIDVNFDLTANRGDTSGTGVIVGPLVLKDTTNSVGFFEFFLRRTGTYGNRGSDTLNCFYQIVGKRSNKTIFKVTGLHVPSTGNVELGDIVGLAPFE